MDTFLCWVIHLLMSERKTEIIYPVLEIELTFLYCNTLHHKYWFSKKEWHISSLHKEY